MRVLYALNQYLLRWRCSPQAKTVLRMSLILCFFFSLNCYNYRYYGCNCISSPSGLHDYDALDPYHILPFTGFIPKEIGNLHRLRVLVVSLNMLTGEQETKNSAVGSYMMYRASVFSCKSLSSQYTSSL